MFLALLVAAQLTDAPMVEPLTSTDGVKGLRATFVVAAAPDTVLQALWDLRRFRTIFPDIHSLEILSQQESTVTARFYVDAVFKMATYTLHRTLDRTARTITWVSVDGDVKSIRGSWRVRPTPDGRMAEVVYTSFVDVGYVVPSGLVRDAAIGKVNEMAARVRAACK